MLYGGNRKKINCKVGCGWWGAMWSSVSISKLKFPLGCITDVHVPPSPGNALTVKTFISSDAVIARQLLCFCRHESLMMSTFPKWPSQHVGAVSFKCSYVQLPHTQFWSGHVKHLFYTVIINHTEWDFSHTRNFQRARSPRRGPHT